MIIALCLDRFISVTHFVIQVEMIKLSIGSKAVCVLVQSEVDIPTIALNHYTVPVVVIKETAAGHCCVALDGAILITP